jgi:FdhD protein
MSDVHGTNNGQNGSGVVPAHYFSLNGGAPLLVAGAVVEEALVCISVDGQELATFMCSPRDLEWLALGFLYNEGLIAGLADVRHLHRSKHGTCVDVWLHAPAGGGSRELPQRKIITAGCGGGITFDDLSQQHAPLTSDLQVDPALLADLMRQTHLGATLYQQARGIHTATLAEGSAILLQVEDVGRHNCLDKLAGAALQQGVATRDRVILSSGRISSEMLNKARRLEVPVVCSRTSPTSLSVALAEAWNMTIVAYVRQDRMRVYTHPERLLGLVTPADSVRSSDE